MTSQSTPGKCQIRQKSGLAWQFEDEHFDLDYWRHKEGFKATIGGRGGSSMINLGDRLAVLRRYQRGGVAGSMFSDQYLWL